jgi:DNA-damage-inducible protein J
MTQGQTINVTIRMDREVKENAEKLFGEFGMNLSTAMNVFTRQALRQGKIPFEIYDPVYREKHKVASSYGRLKKYADPDRIASEDGAWKEAMRGKHEVR